MGHPGTCGLAVWPAPGQGQGGHPSPTASPGTPSSLRHEGRARGQKGADRAPSRRGAGSEPREIGTSQLLPCRFLPSDFRSVIERLLSRGAAAAQKRLLSGQVRCLSEHLLHQSLSRRPACQAPFWGITEACLKMMLALSLAAGGTPGTVERGRRRAESPAPTPLPTECPPASWSKVSEPLSPPCLLAQPADPRRPDAACINQQALRERLWVRKTGVPRKWGHRPSEQDPPKLLNTRRWGRHSTTRPGESGKGSSVPGRSTCPTGTCWSLCLQCPVQCRQKRSVALSSSDFCQGPVGGDLIREQGL